MMLAYKILQKTKHNWKDGWIFAQLLYLSIEALKHNCAQTLNKLSKFRYIFILNHMPNSIIDGTSRFCGHNFLKISFAKIGSEILKQHEIFASRKSQRN